MRTDDETPIELPAGLIARVVGVLREAGAKQEVQGLTAAGRSMRDLAIISSWWPAWRWSLLARVAASSAGGRGLQGRPAAGWQTHGRQVRRE